LKKICLAHKRRTQSRERGLFSVEILRIRGRGFFRCGRSHFLVQKNSWFF